MNDCKSLHEQIIFTYLTVIHPYVIFKHNINFNFYIPEWNIIIEFKDIIEYETSDVNVIYVHDDFNEISTSREYKHNAMMKDDRYLRIIKSVMKSHKTNKKYILRLCHYLNVMIEKILSSKSYI